MARRWVIGDCTVIGMGGQIASHKVLFDKEFVVFLHFKDAGFLVQMANTRHFYATSRYP